MKAKDPALWAALRLYRILTHARSSAKAEALSSFSSLLEAQKAVEESLRLYLKAQSRGWMCAAEVHCRWLILNIAAVNGESTDVFPPRIAPVPAVADLLAELHCLQDEFDRVEILPREKRIAVTTDDIVLEDVRLGAFSIQLHLDRLVSRKEASAFQIVAIAANPASSDSSVTHPHVNSKSLCAGDASAPIAHALAEGRICDAFQLVNRVLHTYNGSSAYVALGDWESSACSDCGRSQSSDELYCCEQCNDDFCDECIRRCECCSQSICLECSDTNVDGDRLCPKCKKLDDQEREEADEAEAEEEEEIAAPDEDDFNFHPDEDQQPQPPTEIPHEHFNAPDVAIPTAELQGGAPGGDAAAAIADSAAKAA